MAIYLGDFGIRFFLCNLFICALTGVFLITRLLLRRYLSGRLQFYLWFPLLGLLAVPFLPARGSRFSQIFLWLDKLKHAAFPGTPGAKTVMEQAANMGVSGAARQINDFALSVSGQTPSVIGLLLSGIWLAGVCVMLVFLVKSKARLNALKSSALPLQNKDVRGLYENCLKEMKIKRNIPIYSTAFLQSPVLVGLSRPRIYLPIHLISDFHVHAEGQTEMVEISFYARDMRYMLLHELQHYKHRDVLAGYLMTLFGALYWFNPLVRYGLKEMRIDREIACDTSVLKLLEENDYKDYGNTLLRFAEKISLSPFPFAAGISGNGKQMRKRILNIASYKNPSLGEKIKGFAAFGVVTAMLLWAAPMLSVYAVEPSNYEWDIASEKVALIDLVAYFKEYQGSFVLYDLKQDTWSVYDMEHALLRSSPDSTYKIYDALFGLEEGIITPEDSFMKWDGMVYPFEAWNADQDLYSAMDSSVNWYFQEIDRQLDTPAIKNYVEKIGYGNQNISSSLPSFWMQSTLKISPVEQVLLLKDLYLNDFDFAPENINTVKDSICLFSSGDKGFYGKTGTGQVDGQDINGWFVGFAETEGNTYFFATNIQNNTGANGSRAAEITKSILAELYIAEPQAPWV